jgi:hypothetical protein
MLRFHVHNTRERQQLEHGSGPIEFGRGPRRHNIPRCTIQDDYVSRDHVRIEELPSGKLYIENLSTRQPIVLVTRAIPPGGSDTQPMPVRLAIGGTMIDVEAAPAEAVEPDALESLPSASPEEFAQHAVRALIDLLGLDSGFILLRNGDAWRSVAQASRDYRMPVGAFSNTILERVVVEGRTVYQPRGTRFEGPAVASPLLDADDQVMGVLCGTRSRGPRARAITPREALLVELLAAALNAHLVRRSLTILPC